MSTAETVAHHLQAFTGGVDEIMQDYTDSSPIATDTFLIQGGKIALQTYAGYMVPQGTMY